MGLVGGGVGLLLVAVPLLAGLLELLELLFDAVAVGDVDSVAVTSTSFGAGGGAGAALLLGLALGMTGGNPGKLGQLGVEGCTAANGVAEFGADAWGVPPATACGVPIPNVMPLGLKPLSTHAETSMISTAAQPMKQIMVSEPPDWSPLRVGFTSGSSEATSPCSRPPRT
ncbi:MAG TPA: hypothetical protein VGH11_06810 [Jatrophihabitans sp.]